MLSVKKKGLLNLIFSLVYKIVTMVIGIIIPVLFITSYGSEINGLQSSVQQIFSYIMLLEAGVGTATVQSLFAPIGKNDHEKCNAYLSATSKYYNKIGVIYFAFLTVVSIGYALVVNVETMVFIEVCIYVAISGAASGINFFYLSKLKLLIYAEGDGYIESAMLMFSYILTSVVKIILIVQGVNIILIQGSYLVINLLITVIYYFIAKKKYPWLSFKEKPNYEGLKQKNSAIIHQISGLVFQNVDVLLLTFMCDLRIVSIYTIYKMIINMVTTIIASMSDSVNFIFGREMNNGDENHEKYKKIIDVFNVLYSAIAFGIFVVAYLLILPFMKLYTAGMDINYVIALLPWLYISIELLTVGREAMMRTITVAGHFKQTQWPAVAEAIINIVASIVAMLICKHYFGEIGGLYGVLIGTIIAVLYRTIDINIYANKWILKRSCWKPFKIMITNSLLFVFVVVLIKPIVPTIDNYIEFILNGFFAL
jgi:O-antigen/teichoic acid export membrane protein